jgi:pyruvate, orthophosphate dikinase
MKRAAGILTSEGGVTSHAAIVARAIGKPCVVGASKLQIDHKLRSVACGKERTFSGDYVTIDGSTGEVWTGEAEVDQP